MGERRSRGLPVAGLVVLLLTVAVVAGACGGKTAGSAGTGSSASTAVAGASASPAVADKSAPAFSGETLKGTPVSLESYRGKPLVLIFWASW